MTMINYSVLNVFNHHLKIGEKTFNWDADSLHIFIQKKKYQSLSNLSRALIVQNYA